MTLYREIEESKKVYPAEQAIKNFRDLTEVATDLSEVRIYSTSDGKWLYCSNSGKEIPCVTATSDYQQIEGYAQVLSKEEAGGTAMRFLFRTAFECQFCYKKIVSLHAACIELNGFAVAFTGPSGIGKSTRAFAWMNALGAELISGDRPAVRIENTGSTACGVPWDGKEQIFRDVEKPLRCILEVRRSSSNYLRRLSREQARKLIVQQSFVPMWDTDAAFMAMANVSALTNKTPVYRVFCGPDEDSARMVYDILINHPELIREEAKDMKIKKGFVLRNVMDEYIVMPTGDNIAKFDGSVVLNEVSAFIYKLLENPMCRDDLLAAVLNEYDVDESTASTDLDALLNKLDKMGVLEK
nr:PqqD family peptide modification chaperone [uncultured Blautia sp.]